MQTVSIDTDPRSTIIANANEIIARLEVDKHEDVHFIVYNWNNKPVGIFLTYARAKEHLSRVVQAWAQTVLTKRIGNA